MSVPRVAWHTLEDGGKPHDPALDAIIDCMLGGESDCQVLYLARLFAEGREQRRDMVFAAAAVTKYAERGTCDFVARRIRR